jgi:hypothetical protein
MGGRLVMVCALSCVLAVFIGCGGESGPDVYPVTGTVSYNGQPVEGAVVGFVGEAATKMATGTTDAQGRFELTTYKPGDGAVAGKHKVTVTKITGGGGGGSGTVSMEEAYESTEGPAEAKNELPSKYEGADTSPLEFTVSAGDTNDFKIELTD